MLDDADNTNIILFSFFVFSFSPQKSLLRRWEREGWGRGIIQAEGRACDTNDNKERD